MHMKDGTDITDAEHAARAANSAAGPHWWPDASTSTGAEAGDRRRRAVAGTLLAGPWFDPIAMVALRRVMFPASRLWAAAQAADGDLDRFLEGVPVPATLQPPRKAARAIAVIAATRVAAEAMDSEWERAFFGPASTSSHHLQAIEAARLDARHRNHATRWHLRTMFRGVIPRARLNIATPSEVAGIYGPDRATFCRLAQPPLTLPAVSVSRSVPTPNGADYWLRFPSPSARLGDMVYARVHEPAHAANPPTIIFGHGICVEFDQWKGLLDECRALVTRGFRVIRPEAPWHGRRAPLGFFGGERTIGSFPLGLLDSFAGAMQEWAVLAAWARRTSSGPLVFGGSSLGAMTAQLAAGRSADWPASSRPDALFLVTHTGAMADAVLGGALSDMWAKPEQAQQAGWTIDTARTALSLVDPTDPMPLPGHRIVSILGRRDRILPFESGLRLVERWKVPAANSFIWDRGHFSVPTTLIRTTAPLDRLAEIVARIGL